MESVSSAAPTDRRTEVSRLEAFSDAVMGFALTLLVLSLEVPKNFAGLVDILRGLPAFAICFGILVWVWHMHHRYFRRYGLQDPVTIFLNSVLLFVILVYVYPLKFLFLRFVRLVTGIGPISESSDGGVAWAEVNDLFVIYGIGFMALFATFACMYFHAYRRRISLGLNPLELIEARVEIARALALAGVGGLSVGIAWLAPARYVGWAGWCYALIGVVEFVVGLTRGKKIAKSMATRCA